MNYLPTIYYEVHGDLIVINVYTDTKTSFDRQTSTC